MDSKATTETDNIVKRLLFDDNDKNIVTISSNLKIDIDSYLIMHTDYDDEYIKSLKYEDKIKLLEIDLLSYKHVPEIKLAKFVKVTKDKRSIGGH